MSYQSVISDRGLQFAAKLIKELNKILEIETKLSTAFHLQTDRQIERTNQELEQYLRIYIATKSSPFKVNYGRELKMGFEIRKKRKHAKVQKFVKKMKEMYEETKMVLKKLQEEIKKYTDRNIIFFDITDKK